MKTIKPKLTDTVLHNPGCGAMLLQRGHHKIRFDQLPQDAWFLKERLLDKIEFSISWSMLEPEEGKILWDQPDWEGCMQSWIDAGYKVALDVRGMGTWGTFYDDGVPQWVFDAGAEYIDEPLSLYKGKFMLNFMDFEREKKPVRYPVYWDEIYLEKVGKLVRALGERYDGRAEIEYVCQGFLGRWGEMHLADHSPLQPWLNAGLTRERYVETAIRMNQMFLEAFPRTRICQEICAPVFGEGSDPDYIAEEDVPEFYAFLAEHGIMLKQNGIGKAWHGTRSRYIDQPTLELFDQYCRQTPVACENMVLPQALDEALKTAHISYWHPGGEREGLHILEHEKQIPLAEKKVWSYLTFYPEEHAKMTVDDEKDVWRMMARRTGWRLEIRELSAEGRVLQILWNNSGSSPCYEKLFLEITLSRNGILLTSQKYPVLAEGAEKYMLPCEIPEGSSLDLKLVSPRGVIELGIEGKQPDGSYHFSL